MVILKPNKKGRPKKLFLRAGIWCCPRIGKHNNRDGVDGSFQLNCFLETTDGLELQREEAKSALIVAQW